MEGIINALGSVYANADAISDVILWALGIFGIHSTLYWTIGFFFTRKFKPAKNLHKYAVCIAARNEEMVIGNLIHSIKRQDYPSELVTIFVVADNCTDNTAKIAREHGAICYERFNDKDRTKGFALQFLFENIKKDYGIEAFEGYFIFDADNLLEKDYISRMNDAFDEGEKIITSYRNAKNFDENWVASSYALHWLRSIRKNHRTRSVLRLATNIQGTGFLFANELIKDGWNYTSLTEDRAFTADAVAHGYKISYNDAAVFYDEQPTSIRIALRQRIRWSKGHLLAFVETGWPLFKNIFVGNCYRDKSEKRKITKESIIEGIRHRLASFDTFAQLIPTGLIRTIFWLFITLILYSCTKYGAGLENMRVFNPNGNIVSKFMYSIFGNVYVNADPGVAAMMWTLGLTTFWRMMSRLSQYIERIWIAVYVFFMERKRIIKIPLHRKILYCLTWPCFDSIHRYATYIALFTKVTWKPIPHTSKVKIEDIDINDKGEQEPAYGKVESNSME